jgi:hypothetical protein
MPGTPWPRQLMVTITDQSKRAASLFRFESLLLPRKGRMWALAREGVANMRANDRGEQRTKRGRSAV